MRLWPFSRKAAEASAGGEARSLENPAFSLSDPRAWDMLMGGSWSDDGGQIVSAESMLGLSAYWAGVNFLSGALASLPAHAYKTTPKGRRAATTHPVYNLVHGPANEETTAFDFRRWLMQQVFTTGRGLAYIERGRRNVPIAFWPIQTGNCVIERLADGRKLYHVQAGSRAHTYAARDVIDIPWMLKPDGLGHYNPVQTFRAVLANALGAQAYAKKFFEKGAVPPFVLEGPFNTSAAAQRAQEDLSAALTKQYDGRRTHALALPLGHSLKPVGISPQQSQLVELRRFAVTEAARFFNLPPTALQDYSDSKYSTAEQQDIAIHKHGIRPWLVRIEQEFTLKLFGVGSKHYVEHNIDALLRADYKTRTDGMAKLVQFGILTPNEAREFENLPPLPGGDQLFISSANVPLTLSGQAPEEVPPAAPQIEDHANED